MIVHFKVLEKHSNFASGVRVINDNCILMAYKIWKPQHDVLKL